MAVGLSEGDEQAGTAPRAPATAPRGTTTAGALVLRRTLRKRQRWLSLAVALVGLAVTAGLTIVSAIGYNHNEQRLTALESKLTATLVGTAPAQLEAQLGRIVGLAAQSPQPAATFRTAVASSLAPRGPFVSAELALVHDGTTRVLLHVGAKPIRSSTSAAAIALVDRAARTSSLVTTRVVGEGVQKLGYLLSARGPGGVYVVGAGQQLPLGRRVTLPASSPLANLNFALYFGRRATSGALIETDADHLPLRGTVSTNTVPFGTSVLTFVVSPRGPLSGPWLRLLPWGILVVGVLLTLLVAAMTERLVRRRAYAETLATTNRRLYREQRNVATTLQQALLPAKLPQIAGFDLAARYIPSTKGADVGGDWYSVMPVSVSEFFFVVGDVSGHGITSAGLMGSLRYTIRTLARLGLSPAEVLTRAGEEIDVGVDNHFATVLVGKVDTVTSRVRLASAGHPPPLVLSDGAASFLDIPVGHPLGVPEGSHTTRGFDFSPGTTLLGFTDGLVERRGESLDVGLARLREAASIAAPSVDALVEAVTSSLGASENEDDIAILAIRYRP